MNYTSIDSKPIIIIHLTYLSLTLARNSLLQVELPFLLITNQGFYYDDISLLKTLYIQAYRQCHFSTPH